MAGDRTTRGGVEATKGETSPGRPTRERRSKLEKMARMVREVREATGPGWMTKRFTTDAKNRQNRGLLVREKVSRAFRWRWINEWLRHLRLGGGRLHGQREEEQSWGVSKGLCRENASVRIANIHNISQR